MPKILVVDDELSIRESFSLILEGKYDIVLAASGEAALKVIAEQKVDMVYLDIRMPGMDGLETLAKIKALDPDPEVIMITAVNDVQKASQAIKLDARDYVVKPFDVEHILKLTEQILLKRSILDQSNKAQQKTPPPLVGQSEKIRQILKAIDKLEGSEHVLLIGEKGTEKESIARLIHTKSQKTQAPFVAIDLSNNLPTDQIKKLVIDQDQGTLFINNIEAFPTELLTDLLPQVRLITATSLDLPKHNNVLAGYFAEVVILVPSLRQRSADIPLLIHYFIDHFNLSHRRQVKITKEAEDALTNYLWPGNTRQLELVIEKLILATEKNQIDLTDLPIDILLQTSETGGENFLALFEQAYIQTVFNNQDKDQARTSAFLGITPTVLETKI
ncbi:MAG: response regulator [bacterium]